MSENNGQAGTQADYDILHGAILRFKPENCAEAFSLINALNRLGKKASMWENYQSRIEADKVASKPKRKTAKRSNRVAPKK